MGSSSHRTYLLIHFRKSIPPHDCRLVYCYLFQYQVDDSEGGLTFCKLINKYLMGEECDLASRVPLAAGHVPVRIPPAVHQAVGAERTAACGAGFRVAHGARVQRTAAYGVRVQRTADYGLRVQGEQLLMVSGFRATCPVASPPQSIRQ